MKTQTTGTTLMLIEKNLLYLLGIAATAIVATTFWPDATKPSAQSAVGGISAAGEGSRTVDLAATKNRAQSREAIADESADPTITAPYTYEIEVYLRSVNDVPAAHAPLWLAPRNHPLNKTYADENGRCSIKWRARTPTLELVYTSPTAVLGSTRLLRTTLAAGTESQLTLRTRAQNTPRRSSFAMLTEVTDLLYPKVAASEKPPLLVDATGFATFSTRDDSIAELEDATDFGFESSKIAADSPTAQLGVIEGRVLDSAGEPCSEVLVFASTTPDRPGRHVMFTDKDGTYRLPGIANGHYHLRAGGGNHGVARSEVELEAGGSHHWEALLDRGLEVNARLIDPDGKPLAGWRIELTTDNPRWIDGAQSGANGEFSVPNLENRRHRADFYPPAAALPAWSTADLWPQNGVAELRVPRAALQRGRLIVAPHINGERDWPFGPVIAFTATGFGVQQSFPEHLGFAFEQLPVGSYEVHVLGDGLGFDAPSVIVVIAGEQTTHAPDRGQPTAFAVAPGQDLEGEVCTLEYVHANVVSNAGKFTQLSHVMPGTYLVSHHGRTERVELTRDPPAVEIPTCTSESK